MISLLHSHIRYLAYISVRFAIIIEFHCRVAADILARATPDRARHMALSDWYPVVYPACYSLTITPLEYSQCIQDCWLVPCLLFFDNHAFGIYALHSLAIVNVFRTVGWYPACYSLTITPLEYMHCTL